MRYYLLDWGPWDVYNLLHFLWDDLRLWRWWDYNLLLDDSWHKLLHWLAWYLHVSLIYLANIFSLWRAWNEHRLCNFLWDYLLDCLSWNLNLHIDKSVHLGCFHLERLHVLSFSNYLVVHWLLSHIPVDWLWLLRVSILEHLILMHLILI